MQPGRLVERPSLLHALPDELLLRILWFLDVDSLLSTARTSRHLRTLSSDPLLHQLRRRYNSARIDFLYPRRPPLGTLQPPLSNIYLGKTHTAARRLHWSLVCIRLNRSISRRPKLSSLVAANILPKECCRYDRRSGEIEWGTGVAGALVERKRRVEREQIKEGLRVWLERKARRIGFRNENEGRVGILLWRLSRKMKLSEPEESRSRGNQPNSERVSALKRFWEGMDHGAT